VQRKLTVGRTDDPAEVGADRVADAVMRVISSTSPVSTAPLEGRIRRSALAGSSSGGAIDPVTESRIQRA